MQTLPKESWYEYINRKIDIDGNIKERTRRESQDGGVGGHTAPPRTTRTDRGSNSKGVRHQGNREWTYIQTGRRGGDRHQGSEDSSGRGGTKTGGVWDERGRQSDH